jgi:hypothetical protein
MAFGSLERYLFVFHANFLRQHPHLLRHLPMLCTPVFWLLFNAGFTYAYPCTQVFYYSVNLCGVTCYTRNRTFGSLDLLSGRLLPICVMVIANAVLLIRVFIRKRVMQQNRLWRKNMAMTLQLSGVALLHYVSWLEILIVYMYNMFSPTVSTVLRQLTLNYFFYMPYLVVTLCPLVCLVGLKEVRQSIKDFYQGAIRHRVRVAPTTRIYPIP